MLLGSLCFVVQVRSSGICEPGTGILKISCSFWPHVFQLLRNSSSRFIPSVLYVFSQLQSMSSLCKTRAGRLIFTFRKKGCVRLIVIGSLIRVIQCPVAVEGQAVSSGAEIFSVSLTACL